MTCSVPPNEHGVFALDDMSLRQVPNLFDEAIQIWDANGKLLFANLASASLFGVDGVLSLGASCIDFGVTCFSPTGAQIEYEDLPFFRVLSSGESIVEEVIRIVRRDGSDRWIRVNAQPWQLSVNPLVMGAVTTQTDITSLVEQENRLRRLAHYDLLTRLPNRALFADRMRQALAHSERTQELLAVCMVDLDGFKPVNDKFGHKAGDQVLREVAQRLREGVRGDDTVARMGGDEFAVLLGGLRSVNECDLILRRILDALARPYDIGGEQVTVSGSIGVTIYPNDGGEADILLRHADQAMYKAKEAGKNRYTLFDSGQELRVKATQSMLQKIERSIASNQFSLVYQPQIDCRRGVVVGVEALVRWQHPILGLLAPSEFLPLIEHDDLIITLGDWVLRDGLAQAAEWYLSGLNLKVGLNISARQLHCRDFVEKLKNIIDGYPPEVIRNIEIEIVETAALEDVNTVSDSIRECRALGISIALDDFGTGFSSLVHLKRLKANVLKIDQTFIKDMLVDPEDLAIVSGVIGLASAFKHKVVAEGVETIDHILMLLELGCDVMQGYGLARPMRAKVLPEWIANFQPDPLWRLAASPRPNRDYFELLLAESGHRIWVDRLVAYANSPKGSGAIEWDFDVAHCQFGRWYSDDSRAHLRVFPAFRAMKKAHDDVHRLGEDLYRVAKSDELSIIKQCENKLLLASNALITLMRDLRAVIAREILRELPPSLERGNGKNG